MIKIVNILASQCYGFQQDKKRNISGIQQEQMTLFQLAALSLLCTEG